MQSVILGTLLLSMLAVGCNVRSGSDVTGDSDLAAVKGSRVTEIRNLDQFVCKTKLVKVAFFDADSTIRVTRSGAPAANAADDVMVLPLVATRIAKLNTDGYLVAMVSNQGGVGAGYVSATDAAAGLLEATKKVSQVGIQHKVDAHFDYIDMAEASDEYRKPKSGMGQLLKGILTQKLTAAELKRLSSTPNLHPSCEGAQIDWSKSFMVGDAAYKKNSDTPPKFFPNTNVPYPRKADDFSNGDRLFAEEMTIDSVAVPLGFQEPAEYFDWWRFRVGNLVSDKAKKEELTEFDKTLSDFLDDLEKSAKGAKDEAFLLREIAAVRRANK
ncbi:MAG: hypothetical protein NTV34_13760 [Proteobacteria bacterium]|nr:hypothetical protein [Pseudomonadota bacterium]